jgi:hypothetical protein
MASPRGERRRASWQLEEPPYEYEEYEYEDGRASKLRPGDVAGELRASIFAESEEPW